MLANTIPSLSDVMAGTARFSDDMRIWEAKFGDLFWLLFKTESVENDGVASSSIVWGDLMHGRGATFGHANSAHRSKYEYCLTLEMVRDLKIAAVIHGYYPALIKNARVSKEEVSPQTVKARIDDLAKIFSAAVLKAATRGLSIRRLQDISFSLLKEVIAEYPGRGLALKRALKLISAPYIQMNLSGPLKWQLVDIEKGSIHWPDSNDGDGIQPLPDVYFLAIQDHCMAAIRDFITDVGLPLLCAELAPNEDAASRDVKSNRAAIEALLQGNPNGISECAGFRKRFGLTYEAVEEMIADAQCSAIMILLLFTGMRRSETQYVLDGSLFYEHGYWFIKSKVVKQRKKDAPISEGWLAIDIVRDAYEVLSYFCRFTKQKYLISSPFGRFKVGHRGYASATLNIKLSRWLARIDVDKDYSDWKFSVHQCRETLVAQLAHQQVKLPYISMQLKHFHSRFNSMPNEVTAGYGNYRSQLMASVATRLPQAREFMMKDLYSENAKFAGGGAEAHKARIDAFFAGMGLYGEARERYIEMLARRSSRFQPTSIGGCVKNFDLPIQDEAPPCYGDYECDPDCQSHVITERGGQALRARRSHALGKGLQESNEQFKVIWLGLADKLGRHVDKLGGAQHVG
jgi:integrase